MKEQTRRTTTEVLLHQVAVVRVVETQVEEIKTEGALVEVAHQAAAVQQEAVVQQTAAAQPNQRNFVSTTKTRTEIGATHRQQRDGVLDCFERFDLIALF
jgi:DNA-directed RNA polymerase subunit E'/Rpb7